MKKFITATLLFLFAALYGFSQDKPLRGRGHDDGQHRFERIHAIKVAYITDKLHFTSEQSAQFWPVYDKYEQEVRRTRREFFDKYKDQHSDDDNTSKQFVDDDLDYQQDILNIKRRYKDDFLKIISSQQLADLYKAEREFKMLLLKELNERHKGNNDNWGKPDDRR